MKHGLGLLQKKPLNYSGEIPKAFKFVSKKVSNYFSTGIISKIAIFI
jgi:hypothetical protein